MSHIHVPDGVLPLWLAAGGWLLTATLLVLSIRRVSAEDWVHRLPLLAVVAALMVVGMTLEIVPIGYHLNLSVVAGIVLGPALGFVAAFIVNLILAMFGHGGVTVIGLNTLTVGSEAVAGYFFFRALLGLLSAGRAAWAAGIATLLALLTSALVLIGIVALASIDPVARSAAPPEALSFSNPFDNGIVTWQLFAGGEDERAVLDPGAFARIVLTVGPIGWLLESVVSALIVRYVVRLRPQVVLPPVGVRRRASGLQ